MLVTDDALVRGRDLVALCRAAERGGVTSVQLRLKDATPRELAEQVRALRAALGIPVLVNDRADVALACQAAGVHLGVEDVPPPLVRRLAPPGFVIGASVGTEAEVATGRGADYWGVGPYRETGTKADAGPALGEFAFAGIVRRAEGRPCVAIGGVRPDDVPAVLAAGGAGVAVVSGILGAEDVEGAARAYARALSG
jgi:thiamine-phosphate pyrophosphorylase